MTRIPTPPPSSVSALMRRISYGERAFPDLALPRGDFYCGQLIKCDLKGANFERANFERARLESTHLSEANLIGAEFINAGLVDVVLTLADLRYADLSGAVLRRCDLRFADLRDADLTGATLDGCRLFGAFYSRGTRWPKGFDARQSGGLGPKADWSKLDVQRLFERVLDERIKRLAESMLPEQDLSEVKLERVDFSKLNLRGIKLTRAILRRSRFVGAYLDGAQLQWVDLSRASLHEASLKGAHLHNAKLVGADLSGSDLRGADLAEANLAGATLEKARMKGARYTLGTVWPEGFDPSSSGALGPRADLEGEDLSSEDLCGVRLMRANLAGVDLTDANLARADLTGCDLSGAKMSGADLSGACLAAVEGMPSDLRHCKISSATYFRSSWGPAPLARWYREGAVLVDPDQFPAEVLHALTREPTVRILFSGALTPWSRFILQGLLLSVAGPKCPVRLLTRVTELPGTRLDMVGLPLEQLKALADATFRQKVWLAPSPARDRLNTLLNFAALTDDIEALMGALVAVEVVAVTQEIVTSWRFDADTNSRR